MYGISYLKQVNFFKDHTQYIHLTVFGENKEDLHGWHGWVQSKIRHLTNLLATPSHSFRFRPYPRCFSHSTEKRKYCKSFFIGLTFINKSTPMDDISFSINRFKSIVFSWHKRKSGMDLETKIIRRSQVPDYTRADYEDESFPTMKSQEVERPLSTKKHSSKLAPLADEFKTLNVEDNTSRLPSNTAIEAQQTVTDFVSPTGLIKQQNGAAIGKKKTSSVWKVKQDPHAPHHHLVQDPHAPPLHHPVIGDVA